jgi:hypothetical protein
MPRRWSNSHGGGGSSAGHRFVENTPVRTADLKIVDEILAGNARIAGQEKDERKRLRKRR